MNRPCFPCLQTFFVIFAATLFAEFVGDTARADGNRLAGTTQAATSVKPNILYILADDMGYADPGFNGCQDIKTPNLDKLARAGAILKSFYVQPVCSPTRSALMTGRYPIRTGVYTIVRPNAPWGLKLEERTLAQALCDAGYETAIDGKWHLGEFQPAYRPTQRGFDHQYGLWFGMIDYFTHMRGQQLDWHRDDQPCHDEGYSTHLLAKEACRLIREKNPDKPLFLYLPFNAVHAPLQVPDNYCQPYANIQGKRHIYAGMVAAMDEAVGQVLSALDEKGIRDNTLIIFSSDNGGFAPAKSRPMARSAPVKALSTKAVSASVPASTGRAISQSARSTNRSTPWIGIRHW